MQQIYILFAMLWCGFSKGWSPLFQRMLPTRLLGRENNLPSAKIIDYPKLDYRELTEQNKYDLQWYVIGETSEFVAQKLKKVTIWNKNYVVWKTENNTYMGLDDVCSHKGASLSGGKLCNNQVVCPYHGYEFDENGKLTKVPGICFRPSPVYDVAKYTVVEKNGWVYLNTFSGENKVDNSTGLPFSETFYTEEEITRNFSVVYLNMNFNCYSRIVSENSLDVMHIGFVHTFGNAKRPAPTEQHPPRLVGPYHYKTSYLYEAGEDSVARKVFGHKNIIIENEFILPHTTVARVMFGDFVSTVITFALPITETKSRLFVKTYRNFWDNPLGDMVTENMMYKTMLQDKLVIENIDMRYMDGKFNMRFDKLQNTYKSFYKRFVHNYSDQQKERKEE